MKSKCTCWVSFVEHMLYLDLGNKQDQDFMITLYMADDRRVSFTNNIFLFWPIKELVNLIHIYNRYKQNFSLEIKFKNWYDVLHYNNNADWQCGPCHCPDIYIGSVPRCNTFLIQLKLVCSINCWSLKRETKIAIEDTIAAATVLEFKDHVFDALTGPNKVIFWVSIYSILLAHIQEFIGFLYL